MPGRRTHGSKSILVVANMSDEPIAATLDLTADFTSLIGNRTVELGQIELDPYEFDWLSR